MRSFMTVLVISSVALAGCSGLRDSKVNPANWFGKNKAGRVATAPGQPASENPLIPTSTSIFKRDKREIYIGTAVDNVVAMSVEPLPSGAIIRVTGVSRQQGAYDVRLTSDNNDEPVDGILRLKLEAVQPIDTPQGSQSARTVQVGKFISSDDIENTNVIQIIGGQNVISRKN